MWNHAPLLTSKSIERERRERQLIIGFVLPVSNPREEFLLFISPLCEVHFRSPWPSIPIPCMQITTVNKLVRCERAWMGEKEPRVPLFPSSSLARVFLIPGHPSGLVPSLFFPLSSLFPSSMFQAFHACEVSRLTRPHARRAKS